MALTGQLSDMSLAELIEFFCNQRKTGRLKIDYPRGHSVFFISEGELVDAKVGALSGVEAVPLRNRSAKSEAAPAAAVVSQPASPAETSSATDSAANSDAASDASDAAPDASAEANAADAARRAREERDREKRKREQDS